MLHKNETLISGCLSLKTATARQTYQNVCDINVRSSSSRPSPLAAPHTDRGEIAKRRRADRAPSASARFVTVARSHDTGF